MKKRFLMTLVVLCLIVVSALPVFAAKEYMIDNAGVLTKNQQRELNEMLEEMSKNNKMDIVFLTESELDDEISSFADDYYDYNGYAENGMLVLVETETGDRYISLTGKAMGIFEDDLDMFTDAAGNYFDEEEYYDAFVACAKLSDQMISSKKQRDLIFNIVISIAVGLVAALIVTGSMKSKMKSVHIQTRASDYVKSGSLDIKNANDFFLYSIVTRTRRANNNSSGRHTSSSGRTHSGGRF
ncbi:MAG: hypothetical protein E7600_08220 [Ruminococcaceae bacterium]|nr:hypothetical protein [Oscillospiraceae bacterium]